VLSFRYSSADAVLVHLTPLPPVAPAGAWSAGGIESISPKQTLTEKTQGRMHRGVGWWANEMLPRQSLSLSTTLYSPETDGSEEGYEATVVG
jgi:hypothetical protein